MIPDIKHRALHRIHILEGQLQGVEHQIESEEYCIDIITQILAIQKSLGSLSTLMIENHLNTHVVHMVSAGGEERERAIAELLRIYDLKANRGQ